MQTIKDAEQNGAKYNSAGASVRESGTKDFNLRATIESYGDRTGGEGCYRIGYGPLDNSIDTVLSLLRSNTLVMSKGTPKTQRCYIKRRGATKIAEVLQIAEVLLQSQKCHGGSRCALVAEMRW